MPDWLVILLLMGLVIVAIQPAPAGFEWYQGLRRPAWFRGHVWQPLLRPVVQLALGCLFTPLELLVQWRMIPLLGAGMSGAGPAPVQPKEAPLRPRRRRVR